MNKLFRQVQTFLSISKVQLGLWSKRAVLTNGRKSILTSIDAEVGLSGPYVVLLDSIILNEWPFNNNKRDSVNVCVYSISHHTILIPSYRLRSARVVPPARPKRPKFEFHSPDTPPFEPPCAESRQDSHLWSRVLCDLWFISDES